MKRKAVASSTPKTKPPSRRAMRPRPMPRWLTGRQDLDEVAQRRCLMVLSVLSGERPVTAAIAEHQISRGFYYQLEEKALNAMLVALAPGAEASPAASPAARIGELESKVEKLEQERRRLERLLYLTRKIVPAGPVAMVGRGRPRKPRSSAPAGPARSRSSRKTTAATSLPASTPTPTTGATTP